MDRQVNHQALLPAKLGMFNRPLRLELWCSEMRVLNAQFAVLMYCTLSLPVFLGICTLERKYCGSGSV